MSPLTRSFHAPTATAFSVSCSPASSARLILAMVFAATCTACSSQRPSVVRNPGTWKVTADQDVVSRSFVILRAVLRSVADQNCTPVWQNARDFTQPTSVTIGMNFPGQQIGSRCLMAQFVR